MKCVLKQPLVVSAFLAIAAASTFAGPVTLRAPQPLVALAQKWAETYMSEHPQAKIKVTGGGSDAGFTALQNKKTELAAATRKISPNESQTCTKMFGRRPREYRVAIDGLSVYVNADNSVTELDLQQLRNIFSGKVRKWKQVGGADVSITVYGREKDSDAYEFFKEHVLKGASMVGSAQTMPGIAGPLRAVSRDKGGIGYSGPASGAGAKPLRIKKNSDSPGIEPNEETVLGGSYPVRRYLYIYLDPARDTGEIAAFLNWVRSDQGQKVVQEAGYYPLPPNLREKPNAESKPAS